MNISAERRSITIAGTYKPRRHEFVLKPIFVSSQMPTDISDRTDAIKRLASVKAYEAGRPDAVQQYMDIATQEFEAHTLTVVQRNESFGARTFLVPMDIVCVDGAASDSTYVFAANVPYLPRVHAIDFYCNQNHLFHFAVPLAKPVVEFEWAPGDEAPRGQRVVTWRGVHSQDIPLHYYVAFESAGRSPIPLTLLSEATVTEIDFSTLPAGIGRLMLIASDGYNTVEAFSDRFYVPCRPCAAVIVSPADGSVVPVGRVTLRGQGVYDDGQTIEAKALAWTSDRDGLLGYGGLLTDVSLSDGEHQITLTAGVPGTTGITAVKVTVMPE